MPKRREGKPTVEASPLAGMLYFPSALIVDQLPAGLASVGHVPALQAMPAKTHAAKVKQYAAAIQRLAKVYLADCHERCNQFDQDTRIGTQNTQGKRGQRPHAIGT